MAYEMIEIPFGTYTIPEDMTAEIKDGKIVVKKKESEDERIRKVIVKHFEELHENSFINLEIPGILAYLERQKEQKPLSTVETELNSIAFLEQMGYTCIHRESRLNNSHNGPDFKKAVNDLRLVACLFANWKDEPSRKTNDGKLIVDVDAAAALINANHVIQESDVFDWEQAYQKGLKHGEIAGYNKAMKEQKPAEWGEEDRKEARDNLISVCRDWERGKKTTLLPIAAVRARFFLEHLTEPKEWSEEDEDMLNRYAYKETDGETSYDEEMDWLKSLRPQPKQDVSPSLSEKEIICLKRILDHLRKEHNRYDGEDFTNEIAVLEWLITHPILTQPHWNPSLPFPPKGKKRR